LPLLPHFVLWLLLASETLRLLTITAHQTSLAQKPYIYLQFNIRSSAGMNDLVTSVRMAFSAANTKSFSCARRSPSSSLDTTRPASPVGLTEPLFPESGISSKDITRFEYPSDFELRKVAGSRVAKADRTHQPNNRRSNRAKKELTRSTLPQTTLIPPGRTQSENVQHTQPAMPERPPLREIIIPKPDFSSQHDLSSTGPTASNSRLRGHPEEAKPLRRSNRIAEKQLQLRAAATRQIMSQSRVAKPPQARSRRGPANAKDSSHSAQRNPRQKSREKKKKGSLR